MAACSLLPLQHTVSSAGAGGGASFVPPHVAVRRVEDKQPPLLMPKEFPHPTPASPAPRIF